ncbi:polysaccharide deacetylase family protein [Paraglaciecola hydrolytica]|uniref:WalW protein n=1 Tax=Paraglaciecola hydrolytica TaxID=1799789 RepID=A0A135ZZZ3_9ALTE|nr:polysaccharide deacetylase family protein [Paraglaciecola hydrolytica]KXI28513.1 WalW protein [Paraglaciecola hydrolytica]
MSINAKDKPPILFVLSVDTEEEWDWSGPFPQEYADVKNVDSLPEFQRLCTKLGVKPTYFVDYAVVNSHKAVQKMQEFCHTNSCEIGAHLHPWCNPPYFGEVGEAESHVVNLPTEQVKQKLEILIDKITTTLGIKPRSFRTGRWGIDSKVMQLLIENDINVDSSVYPFYQNEYFSCNGAPLLPYWPDLANPLKSANQQQIFEVPVTVGFNRQAFEAWNKIHTAFARPPLSWTRFNGLAWHTHLLRKNYLCPELSSIEDMISLCDVVLEKGYPVLHMYMHSSSLIDNSNSLLGNKNAFNFITQAVTEVVTHLKANYHIEFCTISQAAAKLNE